MKKQGISLIVLIITIVVLIILAAAVILTLANNNPVENAKEAKYKSDISNIKDLVNLTSTDILLEKENASYKGIIPEEYTEKLEIYEGILYYKGKTGQEEEWAKEVDVFRREKDIPEDWIDIAENTPEDGIALLIGKPAEEEATISFKVATTGKYKVDWGDGSSASYASEVEAIHTYSTNNDKLSADGYLFEVNITPDGGEITKFEHTQWDYNSPLLWCQVGCDTLTDCYSMLAFAVNLKRFETATETSLSKVENMGYMFYECSNLKKIPELNTSNVTDVEDMFGGCSSLTEIPKLDTSKVENMMEMFYYCSSLKTIPLLDTNKVTNMDCMFYECSSLKEIPLLDTSNVTTMTCMFLGCSSLNEIPKLNTNSVTNMHGMFWECSSLTKIPLLDTSQVTYMFGMFIDCSSLTEIPLLDTKKVTNMTNMFMRCSSLKTIPELDTSSVEKMDRMFSECSSLTNIPKLDTSSVTSISEIFKECSNLKSINIANTNLTNTQINKIFVELPTSTNNAVIDITGNPGESNCTRVTAADKGWTVIP